jgi:hypothetical protein
MTRVSLRLLLCAMAAGLLAPPLAGQLRVRPVDNDQGIVGLGLVLRKLNSVGRLMMWCASARAKATA